MIRVALFVSCMFLLSACKETKPEPEGVYFPVLSYLQSQVKHVDTSIYTIIKIEWNGSSYDTTYLPREKFREAAGDFLTIPDISKGKLKSDYQENTGYDELTNKYFLSYTTEEKNNQIKRQEVIMGSTPDEKGNTPVETIIIHQIEAARDSVIEKNLVWETDKRFTVFTRVLRGRHEKERKTIVIWNDFPDSY